MLRVTNARGSTRLVYDFNDWQRRCKSIDLGTFGGIAYYTVKPEGYQLVVTLTPSGAETPVRFIATLTPGQSVTLSTPRKLGEPAIEVSFKHQGDGLFVVFPE